MRRERGVPGSFLGAFLLGLAAILVYSLLVLPGTLDYSHLGFLALIGGAGGLAVLVPRDRLRSLGSLVVATLILRIGLDSLVPLGPVDRILRGAVVLAVVLLVAHRFARLRPEQLLGATLAVLLLFALAPGDEIRAWTHFTVSGSTPRLYRAPTFDYFPADPVETPGGTGLRTLGEPAGEETEDMTARRVRVLTDEELDVRLFLPQDGRLTEVSNDMDPTEQFHHYPAFPYYHLRSGGVEAALETPDLVEGVLRFGEAPALALGLTLDAIAERVEQNDGLLDRLVLEVGERIELSPGSVTLLAGVESASAPTRGTRILGPMAGPWGEGIAVLGRELEVFVPEGSSLRVVDGLDSDRVEDLHLAEVLIADVTGDGYDELLLSSIHVPSRILRPGENGEWELLWRAGEDDLSFRFETVSSDEGGNEIVALSRSRVRSHPLRYLSGYRLEGDTLRSTWRTLITLVDVRALDVSGDGRAELVGLRFGEHRFLVLARHDLPTPAILWSLLALGTVLLVLERRRRGPALRRSEGIALVLFVILFLASVGSAALLHTGDYVSAQPPGPLEPDGEAGEAEPSHPDVPDLETVLSEALEGSAAAERFWYTGWIATYHGKRQVNSMFDGVMHLPEGYVSNVRVNANPLRFFRWEDALYSEERGIWREEGGARTELDPFGGFEWLEILAPELNRTHRGNVLGLPAWVYAGEVSLARWLEVAGGEGIASSEILGSPGEATVAIEVRIDPADRRLVEYTLEFEGPLPGVGWFHQEVFFRFYRFEDPSIEPLRVEEIREHIRRSPGD